MERVKKVLKKNVKLVIGIIIGAIVSGTGVYAATTILSQSVGYDNTSSGLTSTNVQDALDELYTKAASCKKIKDNTVYFAFGDPTTSSTTDYTTLNKNVFVAKNGDQKSVCIIRNSRLHCFDNNNWPIERFHVQQVFSDISCGVDSSYVGCNASDFRCYVDSYGFVYCRDGGSYERCDVTADGSVACR